MQVEAAARAFALMLVATALLGAFAWGGGVAVTGTCHLYDAKDFETIDVTGSIVGYKK